MAFYFHCSSRAAMNISKIPFPGWPQTWKSRGICKIVKISGKTQISFNFCIKHLENSGKMKNMGHDCQQKYILLNFSLLSCSGKKFKMPWKSQGKLREFSFSKMWPPWFHLRLTADIWQRPLAYQLNCYFEYLNIFFIWPLAESKFVVGSGNLISTLRNHFCHLN